MSNSIKIGDKVSVYSHPFDGLSGKVVGYSVNNLNEIEYIRVNFGEFDYVIKYDEGVRLEE